MKLIVFLTCCLTLGLSAETVAQQERVSLNLKNVEVRQFFEEIQRQTDLHFLFNNEQLRNFGTVTVVANDETVADVLERVFAGSRLTYAFNGKMIVVRLRENVAATQQKSLTVRGFVTDEGKQPLPGVTVKLAGVSVGTATDVKGWFSIDLPVTEGTLEFSFVGYATQTVKFTAETDTLRIVMVQEAQELEEVVSLGYFNVDKRKSTSAITTLKMDDIMQPGVSTLDQMLEGRVPGMIFMQNSGQVGAAPKIKIRGTTTLMGSTEPLWVLDGVILQDPVDVDPQNINDLDFVNLLGNAISGLNPADIDQIDVLKDASATAIYGPQASNGVIVITTKKGHVGKPSVSYSLTGTFRQRPRYTDRAVNVMNSMERIAYSREAIQAGWRVPELSTWVGYEAAYSDYLDNLITYDEFVKKVDAMETANTDWLDILMQDTYSHNHTVSISGGTTNLRYYASMGYMDEKGNIRGEDNKRYSAMMNLNLNYNKFNARFSLNGNLQKREYTPEEVGVADYAYNTSRSVPLYDENGELYFYDRDPNGTYEADFNVVNEMINSYQHANTDQIGLQISLGYDITSWLNADVNFSYNVSHSENDIWFGEDSYHSIVLRCIVKIPGATPIGEQNLYVAELLRGGELAMEDTKNETYNLRGTLTFNKMLTEEQNLNASLIAELNSSKYDGFDITRRNYLRDRGMIFDTWNTNWSEYDEPHSEYRGFWEWLATPEAQGVMKDDLTRTMAAILSVSWAWKNTYILNANMRMDWSNRFGDRSNEKFLPIWSVSGRWNMHDDVLYGVSWINQMALKVSYGYQGNMSEQESPKLIIKKGGTNTHFGEYESEIQNFPNPLLRWEKTSNVNVSLEFSLFNNKLRGNLGYYYRYTSDAFLSKKVSGINGVTSYLVNDGTLVNQGVEFDFSIVPFDDMVSKISSLASTSGGKRGFSWRIDPQLGTVINQLIDKITPDDRQLQDDDIEISNYLDGSVQVSGRPLNTFYSYRFKGLNHETGAPEFYGTDEYYQATDAKGNLLYENGEPVMERWGDVYDNMDKEEVWMKVLTRSGCREPFLQGGLSNTFSYRNWVLSFNLSYSIGSKIRLFKMYPNGGSLPSPEKNLRRDWIKRWRVPGDEAYTTIPGILGGQAFASMTNTWWNAGQYSSSAWGWDDKWVMYDNSDLRVASGDYLKMTSLSLRYVVPEKLCHKLYMKSAYLSISGTNLFTICSKELKGQDPSQSGSTELINISVRPTYSLTLNVTF